MNKKIIVLALTPILLLQSKLTFGTKNKNSEIELYHRAEKLYLKRGDYPKALQLYLQIYKRYPQSFPILYNIGNCYFKLGEYPKALLFYRKAQRLRPANFDLQHNLQLTYQKLELNPPTAPLKEKLLFWYYLLNLKQLFWIANSLITLALLLLAINLYQKKTTTILKWMSISSIILATAALISFGAKYYEYKIVQTGIITAQNAELKSGYGYYFDRIIPLQPGTEVKLLQKIEVTGEKKNQTWYSVEVKITEKKKTKRYIGWIPKEIFQKI